MDRQFVEPTDPLLRAIQFTARSWPFHKGRSRLLRAAKLRLQGSPPVVTCTLSDRKTRLAVLWDDMIGINAIVFGNHDVELINALQKLGGLLPADSIFCDIGANVGMLSLWMANNSPCSIVSFEPNSSVRQLFQKSIALNRCERRIRVMDCALGSTTGTAVLHVDPKNIGHAVVASDGHGETIQVRRLDDVIDSEVWSRCRLVKMDVEGYELEVLKGASGHFSRSRPVLVFEINLDQLVEQGMQPSDVGNWLRECGYTEFHAVGPRLYPPQNGTYPVTNIVATDPSHAGLLAKIGVDAEYRCPPFKFMPVAPLNI